MKLERTKSGRWKKAFKIFPQIKLCPKAIRLIQPYTKLLMANYFLYFVYSAFKMVKPRYIGGVVDIVTKSKDVDDLRDLLISMAIYYIVFGLVTRVQASITSQISYRVDKNLKSDLFKTILEKDMEFFDKTSSSELNNIISVGMEEIHNLSLQRMVGPLEAIFRTGLTLLLLYEISPKLTMIVLLLTPSKLYMMYTNWSSNRELVTRQTDVLNQLRTMPQVAIQSISVIKSFATESKEVEKFKAKLKESCNLERNIKQESWLFEYIRGLLDQGVQIALIWFGGLMVYEGALTPGQLSTFTLHFANFIDSVGLIKTSTQALIQSLARCERLFDVVEYESEVKASDPDAITKPELKGEISLNNISFQYPSRPDMDVLQGVSLDIKAGDSVALVGASGSGKSTLTYLLQRFYDISQGEILIDGENIKKYDLTWLRQNIGFVPTEAILFDKSIEENITYGTENYTHEQLIKAIRLANADFLLDKAKFPEGLQTKIGSEGIQLALGQKQSIVLARALIKNPKILILNEFNLGQDGVNEGQLQKIIDELTKDGDRTVIIVTQRIFTTRSCKKICVFEKGKLVQQGTHNELLDKEGAYKNMFGRQFEQRLYNSLIKMTSQGPTAPNV